MTQRQLARYVEDIAANPPLVPVGGQDLGTDSPRFLSSEACHDIVRRIHGYTSGSGETNTIIWSRWRGDIRWARNRATHASDWRDNAIVIRRILDGQGRRSAVSVNQFDSQSLQSAVAWAERECRLGNGNESSRTKPDDIQTSPPDFVYSKPAIWSDATYAQSPHNRNDTVGTLIANAENAGMLSAGYVAAEAVGTSFSFDRTILYAPQTIAQCSLTVRDPEGTGSGWAGASSYDWTRFDPIRLAEIALDKCLRSRNPVAIEPGRYTLILEPQAVYALVNGMMFSMGRAVNEDQDTKPFYVRTDKIETQLERYDIGVTKIGQQIIDERVTISHDPMDPDLGVLPFSANGEPYVDVTWIDKGVLTRLAYNRVYAIMRFRENLGAPYSGAYRMSGGSTSIDEMIATTKRGLIVTRFSGLQALDGRSLLCTGVTRDGLWLIENGKISKAVKNLRFTESPLFVLNQIEQLGVPVPVFSPGFPAVIPPLKVRDFSFTSLIDAV